MSEFNRAMLATFDRLDAMLSCGTLELELASDRETGESAMALRRDSVACREWKLVLREMRSFCEGLAIQQEGR